MYNKLIENAIGISNYAPRSNPTQQMEGWVIKNYDKQMFCKIVTDAFKEKNAESFGGNPKYNNENDRNDGDFIFKYVTNARIEKLIFKKIDEDKPLDMTMMGELIRDTYVDIIEEEWKEILTSNWVLDFKNIRKKIATRVRAVLNQVITNTALGGK